MKILIFIFLLVTALITAGCINGNENSAVTPAPAVHYNITDGFWCRDVIPPVTGPESRDLHTTHRECYQFYPDRTYSGVCTQSFGLLFKITGCRPSWNSSTRKMDDENIKCGAQKYSVLSDGHYEFDDGNAFSITGDTLTAYALTGEMNTPNYTWSALSGFEDESTQSNK